MVVPQAGHRPGPVALEDLALRRDSSGGSDVADATVFDEDVHRLVVDQELSSRAGDPHADEGADPLSDPDHERPPTRAC